MSVEAIEHLNERRFRNCASNTFAPALLAPVMLLVDRLKDKFGEATTLAVHLGLVAGVAFYTLFGAITMQILESPERVKAQLNKRSMQPPAPNFDGKAYRVYLGSELSTMDPAVHACLKYVVSNMLNRTRCNSSEIEIASISTIDSCYEHAKLRRFSPEENIPNFHSLEESATDDFGVEEDKWSFGNALIFAFTVITTIGYGHVAPETFYGRLFCIVYGLIGVPLTLLTIANVGMFLSLCMRKFIQLLEFIYRRMRKLFWKKEVTKIVISSNEKDHILSTARELDEEEEPEEKGGRWITEQVVSEFEFRRTSESIGLGTAFALYLLFGALVLSKYEPEMDFFKALYFNFVTLTTIGLGDFVPKSFDYLFITLVYIGIGLALTTMAIEIAADLLKKIHYAGRKIENMANQVVWFGGKKMTMKNLVKNLGDKFNIPEEELANFDLDKFVDNAIKVEAGEIKTLRKPDEVVLRERAVSYSDLRKSIDSNTVPFMDRFSKNTDLLTVRLDTCRTLDTIPTHDRNSIDRRNTDIPQLDLDATMFTDSSLQTSFDEDYLKTFSIGRSK